jgi:hypothetical protein
VLYCYRWMSLSPFLWLGEAVAKSTLSHFCKGGKHHEVLLAGGVTATKPPGEARRQSSPAIAKHSLNKPGNTRLCLAEHHGFSIFEPANEL